MIIIWKVEIISIHITPLLTENIITLIDVLISCTYNYDILQNYDTYFPILAFQIIYLNAY